MKILVVGGGGREHAIIKKIKENPKVSKIFALPGNGGIEFDAVCVDIKATDLDNIARFASDHKPDFAVIGPDDPLAMGAADCLSALGIPTFGPGARAAIIEGSKVFAKQMMQKYGIPTANYRVFYSESEACDYVRQIELPAVIKADGLALGKGVIIAESFEQAKTAIHKIMTERIFGKSGERIIIEEYLTGPEVSVLAFTDSKTLIPMVSSMDHKRAFDGDLGPNTGGMGVIAPNPFYTKDIASWCMENIFTPTMHAMNREGRPFKGCLYFGLMLSDKGPKVIEYNCRFGDPEAQAVLPLLSSDLLSIMEAVVEERLAESEIIFSEAYSCCVIASSSGYPGKYEMGKPIKGLDSGQLAKQDSITVFHSGTKKTSDEELKTAGGRVLGVTAVSDTLNKAIDNAYAGIKKISFDGMHYRSDIGGIIKNIQAEVKP